MQIDIKFPILVRATPASSKKSERYFYGSHTHRADVREISLSETEVGLDAVTFTAGDGTRRIFPKLLAYDDRLYRPLGNPHGLFAEAHGVGSQAATNDYVVTSPALAGMARRPVSRPVQRWAQWIIDLHGADTERNYKLWPEKTQPPKPTLDRNGVELSEAGLKDVNGDDVDIAMKMFEAQAGRLLVIGGKYWMETTMPCLTVSMVGDDRRPLEVKLDMDFLPQGLAGSTWMRFPLAAYDEAKDFAQQIVADRAGTGDIGHADVAHLDLSRVGFDHNEETAHAMALAVGSNLVRRSVQHGFHSVHAGSAPLFEGRGLARFETVKDAILSNNDIIGQRSNLIDLIPEILDLWQGVKSPRYSGLGLPPASLTTLLVAKAVEMSEDTVINVPAIAGPRL
ncbi:hypothetical protein HFO56_00925 [Rhizobium laguerreae]|uniref:hypothetical protein n=1 Tax=Rhizobium laguerreae TaxID=1076926 RepID=UPI001C90FB54|nr:hypothetical protein [Rhizobium laguerreae]MBY3150993.1 hypothetical protein [Rhizobium laguerreae]